MNVLPRVDNILTQNTPLYIEIQSSPRISPYMVTASSIPWMWIEGNQTGRIRAAFRYKDKDLCEQSLFQTVLAQASEKDWTCSNLFSPYHLKEALQFLSDNGYPNIDLWVGKDVAHPDVGLTVHNFEWETPFWFLLPTDRKLFGWICEDEQKYVGVVFDPLNTMCILHPRFVQVKQ